MLETYNMSEIAYSPRFDTDTNRITVSDFIMHKSLIDVFRDRLIAKITYPLCVNFSSPPVTL